VYLLFVGFFFFFFFFGGFWVKAITAHHLSALEFEATFGFNLSAVGTSTPKCRGKINGFFVSQIEVVVFVFVAVLFARPSVIAVVAEEIAFAEVVVVFVVFLVAFGALDNLTIAAAFVHLAYLTFVAVFVFFFVDLGPVFLLVFAAFGT
jgi:hypothetical protein